MKRALVQAAGLLVTAVVYVVLYSLGELLVMPAALRPEAGAGPGLVPLLAVALVDTLVLALWVSRLRLAGARAWLVVAIVFYGAKTFTPGFEAIYLVPNVTASLVPALVVMMLPLSIVVPLLVVVLVGRWRPVDGPAFEWPPMTPGETTTKLAVLAAFVYPLLFFVLGWLVAWQSPEVRTFHGGALAPFLPHLLRLLQHEPWIYPFEVLRGLVWIALSLPVLFATRGPVWLRVLVLALVLAVVQTDANLLPSLLSPEPVGLAAFLETAIPNIVWAAAITWLMHRHHRSADDLFRVHRLRHA